MIIQALIKKKMFKSSVQLMLLSRELSSLPGVTLAAAQMGTSANKSMLTDIGLLFDVIKDVNEQDLMVVVKGRNEKVVKDALELCEKLLNTELVAMADSDGSIEEALNKMPNANMALISLPGDAAYPIAKETLNRGLHVHLFSDNISIDKEIELKRIAIEKGLLMMGPDCGSSIINGIPLGFTNNVRRGSIGIISAAGTGLQEVSCIIDRMGSGISQAIGVGGRDLSTMVGGRMMLESMKALDMDPETKVVVIISKPPAKEVLHKIIDDITRMSKPVVINLIGGNIDIQNSAIVVSNMEDAARQAVLLTGQELITNFCLDDKELKALVKSEKAKKNEGQKYLRGLFVGGTLCSETISVLSSSLGSCLYTNVKYPGIGQLKDVNVSIQNTCVDLGDDQFTSGLAHPMIDPTIRNLRMLKEGYDPSTAVILLDFVLGYGAHKDPVGAVIPIIRDIQKSANQDCRHITFIATVLGTDRDMQNRQYSISRLRDLEVIIGETNYRSSMIAQALTIELLNI